MGSGGPPGSGIPGGFRGPGGFRDPWWVLGALLVQGPWLLLTLVPLSEDAETHHLGQSGHSTCRGTHTQTDRG